MSKNHYLGCTAYFPEKYASYAMSVAEDVLAGKAVPQEVHLQHKFLTTPTSASTTSREQMETLLALNGVTKRFGPVSALGRVDLHDRRGRGGRADRRQRRRQVDAREDPLGGLPALVRDDRARRARGALLDAARRARGGVEMIYQDLALCEDLDVTANVFLGPRAAHAARAVLDPRPQRDAARGGAGAARARGDVRARRGSSGRSRAASASSSRSRARCSSSRGCC